MKCCAFFLAANHNMYLRFWLLTFFSLYFINSIVNQYPQASAQVSRSQPRSIKWTQYFQFTGNLLLLHFFHFPQQQPFYLKHMNISKLCQSAYLFPHLIIKITCHILDKILHCFHISLFCLKVHAGHHIFIIMTESSHFTLQFF